LRSGISNADSSREHYRILKKTLDAFEVETKTPVTDPIKLLDSELIVRIFKDLGLKQVCKLRLVSKKWDNLICNSRILWQNLDFLPSSSITTIPYSMISHQNKSKQSRLSSPSLGTGSTSRTNNTDFDMCDDYCFKLFESYQHRVLWGSYSRPFNVKEVSICSSIEKVKSGLKSLVIPDCRNLTTDSISLLTRKTYPILNKVGLSRLKLSEPSKIYPLLRTFMQTNHLDSLCLNYTSCLTSTMVYNLGIHCTKLKKLDISCTPLVEFSEIFASISQNTQSLWFPELEELYVENQHRNCFLLSLQAEQTGIRMTKLKTLSLAWNKNKAKMYSSNSTNPFNSLPSNSDSFVLSFSVFPNLKHICLDGLFSVYTPKLPHEETGVFIENGMDFVPEFCVFSCSSGSKVSSDILGILLQKSSRLKSLNLGNTGNFRIRTEGEKPSFKYLNYLNLSLCHNISVSELNELIVAAMSTVKILNLSSTSLDQSTIVEISSRVSTNMEQIILDNTNITGSGLVLLCTAFRNLFFKCKICDQRLKGSTFVCPCINEAKTKAKSDDKKGIFNAGSSLLQKSSTEMLGLGNPKNRENKIGRTNSIFSGRNGLNQKRKFSELGKGSIYGGAVKFNEDPNENKTQNFGIIRTEDPLLPILISVNNCSGIATDAYTQSLEILAGTLVKIEFRFT
ncbi:hypothetical protein BB560_004116, partial [Smittium megazygosporum]